MADDEKIRQQAKAFVEKLGGVPRANWTFKKGHYKQELTTISNAALTRGLAIEELYKIQVEDFKAGPKPDHHDPAHEVWEFGRVIGGSEAYIKIKIVEQEGKEPQGVIWSFHAPQYPIRYPLKSKRKKKI
tara:strand:- start:2462 stop:2851 length:390 start_codon:yes stop_codon:yes gene_type:complete